MLISRTANAGVLIKADGVTVLIDGVAREYAPYKGTPDFVKKELLEKSTDILAYTHKHEDHYDEAFINEYKDKIRSIIGPDLSDFSEVNGLKLFAVPTRHIGKYDISHVSFVLTGEKCVWFMGDASPSELKKLASFPNPNVLIVPFAYVNTKNTLDSIKQLNPDKIIVLHMPDEEKDEFGLWETVKDTIKAETNIVIPEIGETVLI